MESTYLGMGKLFNYKLISNYVNVRKPQNGFFLASITPKLKTTKVFRFLPSGSKMGEIKINYNNQIETIYHVIVPLFISFYLTHFRPLGQKPGKCFFSF